MPSPLAHGIMFHHFHSDVHPRGQGSISADELRSMLEFLDPRKILPAQAWYERALENRLEPGDLCLTFDDTLRCQYDVALPVLKEYGLTGFWFVYTSVLHGSIESLEVYRYFRSTCYSSIEMFYREFFDYLDKSELSAKVEAGLRNYNSKEFLSLFPFYSEDDKRFRYIRDEIITQNEYDSLMQGLMVQRDFDIGQIVPRLWMDKDCIKRLFDDGNIVGLHSYSHPTRMCNLAPSEQEVEYATNSADIQRITGQLPSAMSHPCNSYNNDTLKILEKLGVRLGFCSIPDKPIATMYEFPRTDHAVVMREMTEARR